MQKFTPGSNNNRAKFRTQNTDLRAIFAGSNQLYVYSREAVWCLILVYIFHKRSLRMMILLLDYLIDKFIHWAEHVKLCN